MWDTPRIVEGGRAKSDGEESRKGKGSLLEKRSLLELGRVRSGMMPARSGG